jgi:hypothetical protein
MTDAQFQQAAIAAGFSQSQAKFLAAHVAQHPHTHAPTEVMIDDQSNLDDWSDAVEERLDELEDEPDEDEHTDEGEDGERD